MRTIKVETKYGTINARIGHAGESALRAVIAEPGICTLEIDRRARTARGGHQWMYATVGRLLSNGLVQSGPSKYGRGVGIYPTEAAKRAICGQMDNVCPECSGDTRPGATSSVSACLCYVGPDD